MSKEFIEELRNHAAARTGYTTELIGKAADAIESQAATIARYEVTAENCDLLRGQVEEQAREIERLQLTCNDLDDQNDRIYAELDELKAHPSRVVLPERKTKADYGVYIDEFANEAAAIHNATLDEVARLNQPASAGDDATVKQSLTVAPVAYAAFADNGNIRMWCRSAIDMCDLFDEHGNKAVPLYTHPAALSTNHSEQVREDTRLLDWLEENLADTIYLDDGRIVDIAGRRTVREAIREAAAAPSAGSQKEQK